MKRVCSFKYSSMTLALAAAFGTAHAVEPIVTENIDPRAPNSLNTGASEASVGIGYANDATRRFGEYNGIKENGAYGLIAVQGAGWLGKHRVQTPAMIRYGELTEDEVFVSHEAARAGVMYENTGGEPLVTLRYFGPDTNPGAPNVGDYKK